MVDTPRINFDNAIRQPGNVERASQQALFQGMTSFGQAIQALGESAYRDKIIEAEKAKQEREQLEAKQDKEAERYAYIQGLEEGEYKQYDSFVPQDSSPQSAAYRKGIMAAFSARLDTETKARLLEIERAEASGEIDATTMTNQMLAYVNETKEVLPPELKTVFEQTYYTEIQRAEDSALRREMENQRNETIANLETTREQILEVFPKEYKDYGLDPEYAKKSAERYRAQLAAAVASGAIEEEDAQQELERFHKDIYQASILTEFRNSSEPEKYISEFSKLENTPLGIEGQATLTSKMLAIQGDINRAEKLATAEVEAALAREKSLKAGELVYRAGRGQASFEEIEKAVEDGTVPPQQGAQLKLQVSQFAEKSLSDEQIKTDVIAMMSGESPMVFDPHGSNSKKTKAAIDELFNEILLSPDMPPEEKRAKIVTSVANLNYVPDALQTYLRQMGSTKSPAALAEAADWYGAISREAPQAFNYFSGGSKSLAVIEDTAAFINAGQNPLEAAQQVIEFHKNGNAKQLRQDELDAKKLEPSDYEAMAMGGVSTWIQRNIPFASEPQSLISRLGASDRERLISDYKTIYDAQFLLTMNEDSAQKRTEQILFGAGGKWGVTQMDGDRLRITEFPMEKYYSNPLIPDSWMRMQLLNTVNEALAGGVSEGGDGDIMQLSDPSQVLVRANAKTRRQIRAGQRPSYAVFYENKEGDMVPLYDNEGQPVMFRPDQSEMQERLKYRKNYQTNASNVEHYMQLISEKQMAKRELVDEMTERFYELGGYDLIKNRPEYKGGGNPMTPLLTFKSKDISDDLIEEASKESPMLGLTLSQLREERANYEKYKDLAYATSRATRKLDKQIALFNSLEETDPASPEGKQAKKEIALLEMKLGEMLSEFSEGEYYQPVELRKKDPEGVVQTIGEWGGAATEVMDKMLGYD